MATTHYPLRHLLPVGRGIIVRPQHMCLKGELQLSTQHESSKAVYTYRGTYAAIFRQRVEAKCSPQHLVSLCGFGGRAGDRGGRLQHEQAEEPSGLKWTKRCWT